MNGKEEISASRSHNRRPLSTRPNIGRQTSSELPSWNHPPTFRLKQRCNQTNPLWTLDTSPSQGRLYLPQDNAARPIISRQTTDYVDTEEILEIRAEEIPRTLMMPMELLSPPNLEYTVQIDSA